MTGKIPNQGESSDLGDKEKHLQGRRGALRAQGRSRVALGCNTPGVLTSTIGEGNPAQLYVLAYTGRTRNRTLSFSAPICCTGSLAAGNPQTHHPGANPWQRGPSHQCPKDRPLLSGAAVTLLHRASLWLVKGNQRRFPKAAADGDKKRFQCSKTASPLSH